LNINRAVPVSAKDAGGNVIYRDAVVLGVVYNLPCTDPLAAPVPSGGFAAGYQAYALVWWHPMGMFYPGTATPATGATPVTDISNYGPKVSRANNAAVTPSLNPDDGSTHAAITLGYAGVAMSACAAGGLVEVAGVGSIVPVATTAVAIARGAGIGNATANGLCVLWTTGDGAKLGNVIKQNVVAAPGLGSTSYALAFVNPA